MDFAVSVERYSGSGVMPTRLRSSRSASRQTARVGLDWILDIGDWFRLRQGYDGQGSVIGNQWVMRDWPFVVRRYLWRRLLGLSGMVRSM